MDIFVNGSKVNYRPFFPLTWGKLLRDLQKGVIEENHGIVKILLDKENYLAEIKEKSQQMVPQNIKRIDVFTKDTLSITKEGFIKIFALIDSIRCEIPITINFYRRDRITEASVIIKKILASIKPMIDFVNLTGINFSLNFDEILTERGTTLREEIELFIKSFSNLIEIKKKRDNIKTAEYLEQQFMKDMSGWSRAVKQLLREVSKIHNL